MLTILSLCVALAAPQQVSVPQSQDLTLTPGATLHGFATMPGPSATYCDDFNRPDEIPMGAPWNMIVGTQNLVSNHGMAPSGQGNAWMQHGTATEAAATAKFSVQFMPNTSGALKYVAAVTGVGGFQNFYTKIQSQSSTDYNYIGFYVGFNGGGSGSYGGFFAITPVQWGRMDVWYDAGTDQMVMDIDEFDDGSIDYTYYSGGPASGVADINATGLGIGTYGDQEYDDWSINDGCGGGGGLTLSATGTCPGSMTLDVSGATAFGQVAMLYGAAGSFTQTGSPCTGTTVPISSPHLGAMLVADGGGNASLTFSAPAGACGLTVVAVDVSTCTVSNDIVL